MQSVVTTSRTAAVRGATTAVTLATEFGLGRIDGKRVQISLGRVVQGLTDLTARVDANESCDPSAVVSIGDLAWKNARQAVQAVYGMNPQGKGLAAFCGLSRVEAFSGIESDNSTINALNSMAKARAIGLTGPTEANYISACGRVMPKELGGGKTTLGVNTCLPMFESRAGYFGNGLGDGTRDRFLANIRDAVADERAYAKDSLASGPLLEAALLAMQVVENFITMFLGHIDNMIHQMTEAQMPEKQIMILCSRVTFMLWASVLPFHRAVSHVDSSNKGLQRPRRLSQPSRRWR